MTLADRVKQAGVVGAGGGGFPTHVKMASKADTVIANGAECEPLLHKDAGVLVNVVVISRPHSDVYREIV
jgi:Na+-translocating ferredoxin:NAD+ oxidoreductase RnfC subunit